MEFPQAVSVRFETLGKDINYIINNRIKGVIINRINGDNLESLDFLLKIPFVERIEIISNKQFDLSYLESALSLKYIILDCNYLGQVDFTKLNSLEYFEGRHEKNTGSLFNPKALKKLLLRQFSQLI
jgi:hypothetical protein